LFFEWKASTNPASQLGSEISWSTLGLYTGTISGKTSCKESEIPKLISDLVLKIWRKPSGVWCSLRWMNSKALLKSACFWVIKMI
jgi:hypothetical protein